MKSRKAYCPIDVPNVTDLTTSDTFSRFESRLRRAMRVSTSGLISSSISSIDMPTVSESPSGCFGPFSAHGEASPPVRALPMPT